MEAGTAGVGNRDAEMGMVNLLFLTTGVGTRQGKVVGDQDPHIFQREEKKKSIIKKERKKKA